MNFLRKLLLRSNFKIILTAFNNGKNNQIYYDFLFDKTCLQFIKQKESIRMENIRNIGIIGSGIVENAKAFVAAVKTLEAQGHNIVIIPGDELPDGSISESIHEKVKSQIRLNDVILEDYSLEFNNYRYDEKDHYINVQYSPNARSFTKSRKQMFKNRRLKNRRKNKSAKISKRKNRK